LTVAPEQEAFGHLHNVLKWEMYAPVAETPHGQVFAPAAAGSIELAKQMFAELARVFPGPYLHLGADETDELGKGRTMGDVQSRGLGPAYLDYVQRLVTELKPLKRKFLFWGDIAMHSPDLVRALPTDFKQSTIAVVWEYDVHSEGFARFIKPFTDAGMECWVSPGVNNWSRVYPNFGVAFSNIQMFTAEGQAEGCTGQMNTVWNDDGETLFNSNWYGVLFGAAAAWQPGKASIPAFDEAYGKVFHGDPTGKTIDAQRELITAHVLLQENYKRADASDSIFWIDPWSVDGQRIAPLIRPYLSQLRLHAERAMVLIREARSEPSIRESDALDAMELGARRIDLMAYKFQLSDEIADVYASAFAAQGGGTQEGRADAVRALQSLDSTNGKLQDLRDGYTECREMYDRAWRKSYRPYWLRNNLVRYDMAIELWVSRIDRMRAAQRQLIYEHTLPTASAMGIPPAEKAGVR
jgi:hexosaminidase